MRKETGVVMQFVGAVFLNRRKHNKLKRKHFNIYACIHNGWLKQDRTLKPIFIGKRNSLRHDAM